MDPDAREQYRGEPWFDLAARFADDWDQTSFDPDYPTEDAGALRAHGPRGLRTPPRPLSCMATRRHRTTEHAPASKPSKPWPSTSARRTSRSATPTSTFTPVVVLICAYEEEDEPRRGAGQGAADGLRPRRWCRSSWSTAARTAPTRWPWPAARSTFVFPVNLGHGVALRVGYRLCVEHGARYVVTLDADGQNDPGEIETMLQPLVDDQADFVVASRRLGVDDHRGPLPQGRRGRSSPG